MRGVHGRRAESAVGCGRARGAAFVTAHAAAALAEVTRQGDSLVVALSGAWQLGRPAPRFAPLAESALSAGTGATQTARVTVDAAALGSWDSSLLIFLRQGQEFCEAHKLDFVTDALPDRITSLLALARAVPERAVDAEVPALPLRARVGLAGVSAWDASMAAVTFLGEVLQRGALLLRGRVRMRWREFWVVVQSNGSGALPIVTLIALLVGVIIAFLGVVVLKRFGAGYYASYLVGFGMLREMGALMTGIIIAGRTGAAFAAELGSMKITEEIDALTTLGISPVDHLVLPRVLGLFVMMPLLVVYADLVGIVGGMGVAVAMLDVTPTQFMNGLLTAVVLSDALLGVFKGLIFGAIIGLAGCMKGLQAGSDAGAVGRAATSAVVISITLVILANAVVDWLAALLLI
nr:permease component of ABC-type transport system [uncultured bacterium]